jgi:hypothetical protein
VNARTSTPGRLPQLQRAACRSGAAVVWAISVLSASASAHAQEPLAALVVADAVPLLAHADATVRGEAALVVSQGADLVLQERLLALAADPEPAARHRALMALGLLGTPGAVRFLGDCLAATSARGEDDGIATAFGLGLVADHAASSTNTQLLSRIAQGSWKRQRDLLLALLLGMTFHPDRAEVSALRQLFEDSSNRDPEVRGLLLRHLLANDRTFDDKSLRRLLERGSLPEREAVLRHLAGSGKALDSEWCDALADLAVHGEPGEHRALALAALTRVRWLPALDLSLRAMRSGTPAECTQAMRTMLQIGGARLLRAAAPRLIAERDPARKQALLDGYEAPLDAAFADHLARLSADSGVPWPLRSTAAIVLARAGCDRAAPLLRDAFRSTGDDRALDRLATALQASHGEPVALTRLLDAGVSLPQAPPRFAALLRAGHPEAERVLLVQLRPGGNALAALRAFRVARVLALPAARDEAIPALLRDRLGG